MASGARLAETTLKPPEPTRPRHVCGTCGCRLSSYNPGPNCFAHTLDVPWKGPGLRPR